MPVLNQWKEGIWISGRRGLTIKMMSWSISAKVMQLSWDSNLRPQECNSDVGPKWHGSSWQRGIAERGSSRLSTLMIDVPGDLVWDLPWVQQASYLEGGPLMWMLPLYLHVNKKSDYDYMYYGPLLSLVQPLNSTITWIQSENHAS